MFGEFLSVVFDCDEHELTGFVVEGAGSWETDAFYVVRSDDNVFHFSLEFQCCPPRSGRAQLCIVESILFLVFLVPSAWGSTHFANLGFRGAKSVTYMACPEYRFGC